MSEVKYISNGYPVGVTQVKSASEQQGAVEQTENKNTKQGKSQLNALYQQSSRRAHQRRSLDTQDNTNQSVQQRNVKIRVDELQTYIETTVMKDDRISSSNKQHLKKNVDDLLKEVEKWNNSNEKEQSRKVEHLVYEIRNWNIGGIGIAKRLDNLREVRGISYFSPIISEEQMIINGKQTLRSEVTNTIADLGKYVQESPDLTPDSKNWLLSEINNKLKKPMNHAVTDLNPAWFKTNIGLIRSAISALQNKLKYCLIYVQNNKSGHTEKEISNYFNTLIAQIDKIKFPIGMAGGKRVTTTSAEKLIIWASLDGEDGEKSEVEIIPERIAETPISR